MTRISTTLKRFMRAIIDGLLKFFRSDKFLQFLKDKALEATLIRLFGAASMGGIRAWLIMFVINKLVDKGDEIIIEPLLRKIGYQKDVWEGHEIYKRVEEAESDDEWLDAISDT